MPDELQEAIAHHQSGRLSAAAAAYQEILQNDANHANARHLLGVVVLQQGNPARAEKLIRDAIKLKADAAPFHANLAEALRRQGRPAEAIACCRLALQLRADFPEALNTQGLSQAAQGDLSAAAQSLQEAVRLAPDRAMFCNNLANIFRRQGNAAAAAEQFRQALAIDSHLAEAHANLGQLLLEQGDVEAGHAHARRAVELRPDFADGQNNYGNALRKLGRLDEAAACYCEAIGLDPRLAMAYHNLGQVQQEQGRIDEAIANYERAIRWDPRSMRFQASLRAAVSSGPRQLESSPAAQSAQPSRCEAGASHRVAASQRVSELAGRTVLLGWELGGGFGHAKKLAVIGAALAARGARPVYVLKEVAAVAPVFEGQSFPRLQAPRYVPPRPIRDFRACSFADVLAIRGYGDPDELFPMVAAWQQIIDEVRPDLIVADYAPTLHLAAYRAIPNLVVGVGFDTPPAAAPEFPVIDPGVAPLAPQQQLLAAVQEVQRRRNRPAPDTLPGMFADAVPLVCTLPELDQYRGYRTRPHAGPINPLPSLTSLPQQPRFFAYLSGQQPGMEEMLAALLKAGFAGAAYLRGAPDDQLERLAASGLEIQEKVRPLAEVLSDASVLIHHGGLTAVEALAAGRPQLVVPRHLEQQITAHLLERLGVSLTLLRPVDPQRAVAAIRQLIFNSAFAEQTAAHAMGIRARGVWNGLPCVLSACSAALAK